MIYEKESDIDMIVWPIIAQRETTAINCNNNMARLNHSSRLAMDLYPIVL